MLWIWGVWGDIYDYVCTHYAELGNRRTIMGSSFNSKSFQKQKNPLERALSLHVYRSSPSMTNGVLNIDFSLH